MAKLEIPSIVVHNGASNQSTNNPLERPPNNTRTQPSNTNMSKEGLLSEEVECDEEAEDVPNQSLESVTQHSSSSHTGPVSSMSTRHHAMLHHSASASDGASSPPRGPGPGGGPGPPPRSRSMELSHQKSTESDKDSVPPNSRLRQTRGKPKLLQRSHAMREDSSPPPDILEMAPSNLPSHSAGNTLTVNTGGASIGGSHHGNGGPGGIGGRRRLRHQGSSQGSYEGSSPCLSRDSSMEYTDSSGVDLLPFIIQTLHKNQKDRMLLIKIEKELVSLVKDTKRTHHKFPPMSSYQRMLVHRCAAYFGLEHNVDQVGTAVIVNRTRNTRLPESRFRDHCTDEFFPDEPKRSILRRDLSSFDDGLSYKSLSSMDGCLGDSPGRSRDDSRRNSHDDSRWRDAQHWSLEESSHRKHNYDNHRLRPGRLPKVESFESRDTLHPKSLRPPVFKSHSFGGYSAGVTVLSRDSTSSRLSENSSSSGYKTQRQDTSSTNVSNTLSTTPSPTAHHQHPSFGQTAGVWGSSDGDGQAVMWAVTDMEEVPAGAMLINPQSGQPFVNSDGSVYRYDPSNPPHLAVSSNSSSHNRHTTRERENSKDRSVEKAESEDSGHSMASSSSASTHPDATAPSGESRKGMGTKSKSVDSDGSSIPPQVIYPQYFSTQLDTRPFSQETALAEVNNQLRGLCLQGSVDSGLTSPTQASCASTIPPNYILPRHQYPQPVYYMTSGNMANIAGGATGIKYMYPQYQMATVPPPPPLPPTAAVPQAPPPAPTLQAMPAIQNVPTAIPVPTGQPHAAGVEPSTPGYAGSYAVVAYPPGGLIAGPPSTGQESGGTTYYCQIPGPPPPPLAHPGAPTAQAPSAAASSLQQYNMSPSSTGATTFPPLGGGLSYYTANGMSNNTVYHGVHGVPTGFYPGGATGPAPGSALTYRAPTPPPTHTPSTHGLNCMPIGYTSAMTNCGNAATPSTGGHLVTVVPPQQMATPTAQAPPPSRLFAPFIRPSLPMIGGTTGTPPSPVLQYGGTTFPLASGSVTPHPPVFAKPYVGSASQAPYPKEDGKRYAGIPPSPDTHPAPHLYFRPVTLMQNDLRLLNGSINPAGTGMLGPGPAPGPGTAGPLIYTGPGHRRPFDTSTRITPLSFNPRVPKIRRPKAKSGDGLGSQVTPSKPGTGDSLDSSQQNTQR